ncbi:MAG: CoA-binding protein [Myxococcales bacterium]
MEDRIATFLKAKAFGVVGASTNREKYGNKVLRCYQQAGRTVVPVNPKEKTVEGLAAVAKVEELPPEVDALSIITPPEVTEKVVDAAIRKGIKHVWMQPGAESPAAIERAEKAGLNVIGDGSCLLVVLRYSEH